MNHISKIYLSLLILSILASCNISKDVSVGPAPLPATYRNASGADSSGIATIGWKTFFTDPALLQLLDSAISNNYDMQLALKNMEAAQLVVKQSKLGYLPEAILQAGAGISRPSDNSLNGLTFSQFLGKTYLEDYNVSANLAWEADIWGKIKNRKEKALAEFLQTTEARKVIQTNIVAGISKGYYNLLMLDAQLAIARKNLLLNDSTLRIMQFRFEAGEVTSLGVQQATAQRLVVAQLIPLLQQQVVIQENAISVLSGVTPREIIRTSDIGNIDLPDSLSTGVPSALLSNRPDVRSNELALIIANANTGITKAEMYPALRITASAGINSLKASNWFNIPASLFGAAAGSIVQPLFQRKALKTQYELSKIDREKKVLEFRQSVLSATGEVSDALVKRERLKDQKNIAATRVRTLQQAIASADLLFKNGMATYLEVITAQSNSLQGELELASIKKEELNAVVELYRALGGGWR